MSHYTIYVYFPAILLCMIKAIVFDFYGVLIPDAYDSWLERHNLKREGVYSDLAYQFDQGSLSQAEFLDRMSQAIGHQVTYNDIHGQKAVIDQQLVHFIRQLKSNYKIGLLSNASTTLRSKLQTLGIANLFDEIIISSEVGHAKPSDEIFQIAVNTIRLQPSQIVFIDDRQTNVSAAIRNNLTGIRYVNINSLKDNLKQLNIDLWHQPTTDDSAVSADKNQ